MFASDISRGELTDFHFIQQTHKIQQTTLTNLLHNKIMIDEPKGFNFLQLGRIIIYHLFIYRHF